MTTADTDHPAYREQFRRSAGLVLWGLAWVATLAAARFGPELIWHENSVASWIAVGLNVIAGVLWIVAFTRFLRALDDLQRKIMLDALAVTLGVGWIIGFGYVAASATGLVPTDLSPAALPCLLAAVYLVAFAVGRIRYR